MDCVTEGLNYRACTVCWVMHGAVIGAQNDAALDNDAGKKPYLGHTCMQALHRALPNVTQHMHYIVQPFRETIF